MEIINSNEFDKVILEDNLSVVDFSASWCMPCRMLKPIMEKISQNLTDIKVYNVDIDDSEEIAKRYRIFSVPTIICFRNGKKIDSLVGLNSYEEIVSFINRCKNTSID